MTGMQDRLVLPSVETLTGTLRQPRNRCPLLPHNGLEGGFGRGAAAVVPAEKQHAHAVAAGRWQHDAAQAAFPFQKGVRQLGQDACAVARVRFCARSAPVLQVFQNVQGLRDVSCDRLPAMSTIMPMPQASCSKAGEYSPGYPMDEAFMPSVLLLSRQRPESPAKNKKTRSKTKLVFEHIPIYVYLFPAGKQDTEEKQRHAGEM